MHRDVRLLGYLGQGTLSEKVSLRVAALQMGHKYLYAHVSPKKMQNFDNKPARDLVLDLILILRKDYYFPPDI